jgi:uncharacterized protein (DUF2267 family)
MAHTYRVSGGQGFEVPGALGPAELDARTEWVSTRRDGGLVSILAPRLGSGSDAAHVIVGVLLPLRTALAGPPLEALLAHLPPPIAGVLRAGAPGAGPASPTPAGKHEYLAQASLLLQHPPPRAASYARAVFAAAREVLAPDEASAVADRLPRELAELFVTAQ